MLERQHDAQGRWLGIPYDWRLPTVERIKARVWNRGGTMFSPKVFGWGWTLNIAHPGARLLLGGLLLAALLFAWVG